MEHTQGKLTFRNFSIYAADGKTPVADTCLINSVAAHDVANARRLVACWNACEGIPTELLELHGAMVIPPDLPYAALEAQRDELLAGLERIANPIPYEQANVPEGYTLDGHALLAQVSKPLYYQTVARALIAKHKEASHG